MSTESGCVVNASGPVFWHLPPGRRADFLPDSRDLWEVLWEHRADEGLGYAHSHPGSGRSAASPSLTDVTTFDAVERALGRHLRWWITSSTYLREYRRDEGGYGMTGLYSEVELDASGVHLWLPTLRWVSYEDAVRPG